MSSESLLSLTDSPKSGDASTRGESSSTPSASSSPRPLDNLSLAAPYLTVPIHSSPKGKEKDLAPPPPLGLRKDRIYIGNLHPSVDEYTLLQIFGKYGKVAKLDFLFHKIGNLKGKPRGYAFLEYVEKQDALKALVELNDKPFRGRKLVVTFAHQAPIDPNTYTRRPQTDTTRPTALSLLKASRGGTNDKIKAMEAKLAQLSQPKTHDVLPKPSEGMGLPDRPLPSLVRAAERQVEAAKMPISVKKASPTFRNGGVRLGSTSVTGLRALSGVRIPSRR